MPPLSAKRAQRAKRQVAADVADDETPNTSPTQPAKRRRKMREEPEAEVPKLPKTQAELDMSDEDLVSAVSQHLYLPDKYAVQVAEDNSNDLHQRQSKNVAAYAKITGQNWTFYVKRLRTNIGRPPEGYSAVLNQDERHTSPAASDDPTTLPIDHTEDSRIHIDLSPNKRVSRLHAEIFFDSVQMQWTIVVNGRNGVKVDNQLLQRGQRANLTSGRVIEVDGTEMMFVLPENEGEIVIDKRYLRRANLIQDEIPFPSPGKNNETSNGSSSQPRPSNSVSKRPVLAPAPPDYRRPDTPIRQRTKIPSSTNSPAFSSGGGTMMMSSEQVDLSLEQNAHIKPSYTYSQLITQAIMATSDEQVTLYKIYDYCIKNYAFYRRKEMQKGWQNSIRHNLSLHVGFQLRPRESHEPGKGGYWSFKPEYRETLMGDAWGGKGSTRRSPTRRSPKNSATPMSPGKSGRTIHGPGDRAGGSPGHRIKRASQSESPPMGSYPSKGPQFTPDHGNRLPRPNGGLPGDGSPLPRHRRGGASAFGMSDNIRGSPVLSSSFAPDESNSLITPAPIRRHPYLAPPSTAQRPSQHMPTSSPAPFWRFAEFSGNTPIRASAFDTSPIKDSNINRGIPQSSSPAPRRNSGGSPSKRVNEIKTEMPDVEDPLDEEPAFDLTRGFMSISSYHASSNGVPVAKAARSHA